MDYRNHAQYSRRSFHPIGHASSGTFFASSINPDTMYYNQGMAAPDYKVIFKDQEEEICNQVNNQNFKITPRPAVPTGKRVLPVL
jgi:hypothetical protein